MSLVLGRTKHPRQAGRQVLPLRWRRWVFVFGDIEPPVRNGSLRRPHAVPVTPDNVIGILSLVFWALTIVVCRSKYVVFIMRADNRGEGGIMALTALACAPQSCGQAGMAALGMFGRRSVLWRRGDHAGDLGALGSRGPGSWRRQPSGPTCCRSPWRCFGLFVIQRRAPPRSAVFGPVMLFWFTTLGVLGAVNMTRHPDVLGRSIRSMRWFLRQQPMARFSGAGAVVLAITGGARRCMPT